MPETKSPYVQPIALIVIALMAVLLVAKIMKTSIQSSPAKQPALPGEMSALLKHPFTMTSYTGPTGEHDVAANHFEIGFSANQVSGVICNSFSGPLTVTGNTIKSEQIVSTKKACAPEIMDAETLFFNSLREGLMVQANADGSVLLNRYEVVSFTLSAKQ